MAGNRPISDVRIWSVQDRRSNPKYARPWIVRWAVEGKKFQKAHRTKSEADRYRSQLLVAQSSGHLFDHATGEPAAWTVAGSDIGVHEWTRNWVEENWSEWQPRTRIAIVEALSRFVPLTADKSSEEANRVRLYLVDALLPGAALDNAHERWMNQHCPTLTGLDRQLLAHVDSALGLRLDGTPLAASTASRYRKVARSCIRRAVDLEILERDPWPPANRGAAQRKARRINRAVDVRTLPDPATMRKALAAINNHQPASIQYQVMTSVMYYAGLRPSEVIMLRPRNLSLPEVGWGRIDVVEADIGFDESGAPKTGERTVPIPPELVRSLRSWIDAQQTDADGLIFRTRTGKRPAASNWTRAWHRALRSIDHPSLRLYDCRHAAATTWLAAGVPLGEVARRLGHSVDVLVSTYVGALRGDVETANIMIERYLDGAA